MGKVTGLPIYLPRIILGDVRYAGERMTDKAVLLFIACFLAGIVVIWAGDWQQTINYALLGTSIIP